MLEYHRLGSDYSRLNTIEKLIPSGGETMTFISDVNEIHNPISETESFNPKSIYQKHRFWIKLFNAIEILGCEAYINGLELPDSVIKSILDFSIPVCYQRFPFLLVPYEWLLHESEELAESSQELMEIQYNLPKELFKVMLGEDKILYPKYTMALWEKGAKNLEQAQIDKIEDVIEKAQIQDGDEILDLGCGFGSASHYILAKFPNCKVTALNLSKEHCDYMRQKMQEPESYFKPDRFTICEENFNNANFTQKFDKIIAIGLFEHIGNFSESLKKVSSFLKPEGKLFIHIISSKLPHTIMILFLEKYIFPRARGWSYHQVPPTNSEFVTLDKWFINGLNYAKTLTKWLDNFDHNQEYLKTLNYGMIYAKFRRMWRLYLLWCIALFTACDGEVLGNAQYLMVKS
jgi:cyclopropane-fatty-acyl-phospholipid synthase